MDVSRYSFGCQKAFHQGLQFARSYGHRDLEVEHVAWALLRSDAPNIGVTQAQVQQFAGALEHHLESLPKVFGNVKVEFGTRLDSALDLAESKQGSELVGEGLLWECLVAKSKFLMGLIAKPTRPKSSPEVSPDRADYEFEEPEDEPTPTEDTDSLKLPKEMAATLEQFTVDLTAMAERDELDPVIGRDFETRRVLEILGRKKKNNPVLVGEAGVGKTAVAEALALRIVAGNVPESIRGKRLLSLDMGGLVAGARFRGEFEERIKKLVKAVQACRGRVIIFIDEIHLIVGAGRAEGSQDAANLLKPVLARGELRCLGATTHDEYKKYISKDPALERRFQPVTVSEPSSDVTLSIMRGLKEKYEIYHGVQIQDEALEAAVALTDRFLPNRRMPDKAIDVMDEACSRLRFQIDSEPAVVDDLRSQVEQLEIQKNSLKTAGNASSLARIEAKLGKLRKQYDDHRAIWKKHQDELEAIRKKEKEAQELANIFEAAKSREDFEFAAKLQYEELPKIDRSLKQFKKELLKMQQKHSWLRQFVGEIEVAEVVAQWTAVPIDKVLKDDVRDLWSMEERINARVLGQAAAVQKVCSAIKRARVGISDHDRPIGVFLFLGPTGVGKTELAKVLADDLFNDSGRITRIDMSEYMEPHSVARLIGAPPGYVGHDDGGELTDKISINPHSIVLLDEIEKAHPKILDLMLQVFDEGRLTDGRGRFVDFTNTIIIMTSNLIDTDPGENEVGLRRELSKSLRPELVGRIDEVIFFRSLSTAHYFKIIDRELEALNERLQPREMRVSLADDVKEDLVREAINEFGVRALRRFFQIRVVDDVSDRIINLPNMCSGSWVLEYDPDGYIVWKIEDGTDRYLAAPEPAA